jgi:hypothetical protein
VECECTSYIKRVPPSSLSFDQFLENEKPLQKPSQNLKTRKRHQNQRNHCLKDHIAIISRLKIVLKVINNLPLDVFSFVFKDYFLEFNKIDDQMCN